MLPVTYGVRPSRRGMTGGRTIAGQYGPPAGRKQQQSFGRVDPYCLFAVLPLLTIAGLFFWGGIAIVGVVLVLIAILIVVGDSWANRPTGPRAPQRGRQDY